MKLNLTETIGRAWTGLIWLRTRADKDGNNPFMFLYYRLKKDPAPRSLLGTGHTEEGRYGDSSICRNRK